MKIRCLPYKGKVGEEIRPLYFYKAMGIEIVDARIISFGACNFSCPYCKRDGNFRNADGSIVSSISATIEDLFKVVEEAVEKRQAVRISGGDPVIYPEASLLIAEKVKGLGGRLSIAHNGSSPQFIKKMVDAGLESAAIDLKAPAALMNSRTGLNNGSGKRMYQKSIETQDLLSSSGVLVDVRTPIFSNTTLDDMLELAKDIIAGGDGKNEFWTWRLYKPVAGCDFDPPRNIEGVIWMINEVKKNYPSLKIGLRAKWEPGGFMYF
ncbi:MAG: radical SAM protein [Patescibacteria group bacterium]|jgi:pyruvate formate lyase activating enzyme